MSNLSKYAVKIWGKKQVSLLTCKFWRYSDGFHISCHIQISSTWWTVLYRMRGNLCYSVCSNMFYQVWCLVIKNKYNSCYSVNRERVTKVDVFRPPPPPCDFKLNSPIYNDHSPMEYSEFLLLGTGVPHCLHTHGWHSLWILSMWRSIVTFVWASERHSIQYMYYMSHWKSFDLRMFRAWWFYELQEFIFTWFVYNKSTLGFMGICKIRMYKSP